MTLLAIILLIISVAVLSFAIMILVIVLQERSEGKKALKIQEQNRKDIDAAINRILYDCESD